MPGFVPIPFHMTGKILLVVGLVLLLARLVSYLTSWYATPSSLVYFGAVPVVIGLYLVFIVPKE